VPGNHDAYVAVPHERSWALWREYMASDGGPERDEFPALRVRGPLALVGVCSAVTTPPFFATGAIGSAQLARLEDALTRLGEGPLCRVVLLHHPVTEGAVSARRALRDAAALRAVLARAGAELVLHGHGHRSMRGSVEGPRGPIPVVGVRSSSDVGHRPDKRAQYHLYEIEPAAAGKTGPRFRIRARVRGYEPARGAFVDEGELPL
jgi:3',5'-cyclic AMP phosphodiesterase CpdA